MTRHNDDHALAQMLQHAREAVSMAENRTRNDLNQNRMFELALTRLVEIIGEAGTRVSDQARQGIPSIPWAQIVGMRHRLIHGYDSIDRDVLWDTIEIDLPPLIRELERVLQSKLR